MKWIIVVIIILKHIVVGILKWTIAVVIVVLEWSFSLKQIVIGVIILKHVMIVDIVVIIRLEWI